MVENMLKGESSRLPGSTRKNPGRLEGRRRQTEGGDWSEMRRALERRQVQAEEAADTTSHLAAE